MVKADGGSYPSGTAAFAYVAAILLANMVPEKASAIYALGEAVVRIWSNLPQDVQHHLFEEAITSQSETIRPQLAVFLHDKHERTSDPLGKPREMIEPDSLGG